MSSASAIVESRWAITNVVRPAITSRSACLIACSVEASTDEVASSSIEDPRVAQQRAGDRDPLALAAREREPALADPRVVALRQLGDEARRLRALRRALDLVAASPPAARRRCSRATVALNRNGSSSTTLIAPRSDVEVDVAHVGAVDQHRALARRRRAARAAARASSCPSRSRRPARRSSPPRRRGRRRASAGRGAVSYSKVTSRSSTRPRPSGSGGAPGGATSPGSRSRIWNSRAPDAVARWAMPSTMPSDRIGPISISRYV